MTWIVDLWQRLAALWSHIADAFCEPFNDPALDIDSMPALDSWPAMSTEADHADECPDTEPTSPGALDSDF